MLLKDKVAIITGASRGLGLAIARVFGREGGRVVLVSRNKVQPDSALSNLSQNKANYLTLQANVGVEEDVQNVFLKVKNELGRVDVVVNNAGNALLSKLVDTSLQQWNEVFKVHVTGTFLFCREAIKTMQNKNISGRIINISSTTAKAGSQLAVAYCAAKSAILGLTKSLAKEVGKTGITVNAVLPGAMDTEMFHEDTLRVMAKMFHKEEEQLLKATLSSIPLGRLIQPTEVAELVLFLASENSACITGQSYTIDGGFDTH